MPPLVQLPDLYRTIIESQYKLIIVQYGAAFLLQNSTPTHVYGTTKAEFVSNSTR